MWYKKAITKGIDNPKATYYLAEMQKKNQKYEEAKETFKKYKELAPNDPMADQGIQSCETAQKWMNNPSGYQVEPMKFFNSKQSDFSPAYVSSDYMTVFFNPPARDLRVEKKTR
jgi:tetratricopeptide (TPR) repeat protein